MKKLIHIDNITDKLKEDIANDNVVVPEEFIRRASNLINEEKATTIIDGITYNKTDDRYDNEIFTINNVDGRIGDNAFEVKKHIYDFLITDSENEKRFGYCFKQ